MQQPPYKNGVLQYILNNVVYAIQISSHIDNIYYLYPARQKAKVLAHIYFV